MIKIVQMDKLFSPSTVAVIGASNDAGKGGGYLLNSLLLSGFKGVLYPVNPRQTEVMGLKCYSSVMDIPGEVDEAIIAVAARLVPRVTAECARKGVKFAVIHSAGFAELGAEGRALEDEMLQSARQGGTRIVGPNCMGLYNPRSRLNTIFGEAGLSNEPGQVAFIGQSGNLTENFICRGDELGIRFSNVVSIGNQSDLLIEDFMEYFARDPNTGIIACYVEGLKRAREFYELAKEISLRKPIIIWKGGRTEAGNRYAATHTASLAGNRDVFDAALRQSGVISADNLEELLDMVIGFCSPYLPAGNRLGLQVEAGSGAVYGTDLAGELGLSLPLLSDGTQQEIAAALEGEAISSLTRKNPVDFGWLDFEPAARLNLSCARIMIKEVDAIVALTYSSLNEDFAGKLTSLRDETRKPVIVVPGLPSFSAEGMKLLVSNGIPSFTILNRALKVLAAMVRYSGYRQ